MVLFTAVPQHKCSKLRPLAAVANNAGQNATINLSERSTYPFHCQVVPMPPTLLLCCSLNCAVTPVCPASVRGTCSLLLQGKFIHVAPMEPRSDWDCGFEKHWWKDVDAYRIGRLTSATCLIRVMNMLTGSEDFLEVMQSAQVTLCQSCTNSVQFQFCSNCLVLKL